MAARGASGNRVLPRVEEISRLRTGSFSRSIASRILQRRAEHRGRQSRRGSREYRKFLDTAHGSLAEVETALGLARQLEYLEPVEFGRLEALATETGKTLFGLLRKITASASRLPPNSR